MKVKTIRYWILGGDLVCVFGALIAAISVRYANVIDRFNFPVYFQAYSLMVVAAIVLWTFLYFEMSLDGFKGGWHFPSVLSKLIVAVSILMLVVLAFAFLTQHNYSRLVLFYFAVLFAIGLIIIRYVVGSVLMSKLSGVGEHRCVIVGGGRVARELADKITAHPELHFNIVGFLFPGDSEASNGFAGCLGGPLASMKTLQVLELLAREGVQKLIIVMTQPNGAQVRKLITECQRSSIQVYVVPQWYDLYVSKAELVDIDGLPLLSLAERKQSTASLAFKRAIDIVLSAGILALISPLLLLAAMYVYCKKGRAFQAELRCGKEGVPFWMYRLNIERYKATPRVYERLLVRWSLTELPQLWNVLRGDMSLVGPRPESAERTKNYSDWQRQRLKVRGGVTGLAQVHGLRDQHSSEDKARFDLQYIFNWSPLLDLSLILQTVWTLLFRGLGQEHHPSPTTNSYSSSTGYVSQGINDANRS